MRNIEAINNLSEEAKKKIGTSVLLDMNYYEVKENLAKAFNDDENESLSCEADDDKQVICIVDEEFNKNFIKAMKDSLDEYEIEAIKVCDYVEFK